MVEQLPGNVAYEARDVIIVIASSLQPPCPSKRPRDKMLAVLLSMSECI
jgi:hypothetical protein